MKFKKKRFLCLLLTMVMLFSNSVVFAEEANEEKMVTSSNSEQTDDIIIDDSCYLLTLNESSSIYDTDDAGVSLQRVDTSSTFAILGGSSSTWGNYRADDFDGGISQVPRLSTSMKLFVDDVANNPDLSSRRVVYCLEYSKDSPNAPYTYTATSTLTNTKIMYCMFYGVNYYGETCRKSDYRTGNWKWDYIVTQMAIHICNGEFTLAKFNNAVNTAGSGSNNASRTALEKAILYDRVERMVNDATNYASSRGWNFILNAGSYLTFGTYGGLTNAVMNLSTSGSAAWTLGSDGYYYYGLQYTPSVSSRGSFDTSTSTYGDIYDISELVLNRSVTATTTQGNTVEIVYSNSAKTMSPFSIRVTKATYQSMLNTGDTITIKAMANLPTKFVTAVATPPASNLQKICYNAFQYSGSESQWYSQTATVKITKVETEKSGTVKVTKKDSVTGALLKDATFRIYAWDGDGYDTNYCGMTNKGDGTYTATVKYNSTNLGKFKIVETVNPSGYSGSWTQTFTVSSTGATTQSFTYTATNTVIPREATVTLTKKDADSDDKLKDAVFHIYQWDGSGYNTDLGAMTNNADGTYSMSFKYAEVSEGKYKIVETTNPSGYTGIWTKEFVVEREGDLQQTFTYTASNPQEEQPFTIEITKKDSYTGKALSGCTFTVYEYNNKTGKYVKLGDLLWNSSTNKYTSIGNTVLDTELRGRYGVSGNSGKFRIVETTVPDGYVQSSAWSKDITVEATDTGKKLSFTYEAENAPTRTLFKKVDKNGDAIVGATLQIIDENGNVVKEFTSTSAGVEITNLVSGATYTLKETSAPAGYVKADDVTFTVEDTEEVQTVTMVDPWTETKIHKKSLADTTKYVSGASLELRTNKDNASTVVTTVTGQKVQWTSGNAAETIYGIKPGTYWVVETKAPTGYGIAEPVQIVVKEGTDNEVTMYDPEYTDLTVEKKILAAEITFDHGNPTFIINVKGKDVQGNEHTYTEYYEFTEDYVKEHTDQNGYVSISYTWTNIPVGEAYEITEIVTNRYYLADVTSDDTNVDINRLKASGYDVMPSETFKVTANLLEKPSGTVVTFVNRKYAYKDYGHNSVVKNVVSVK